MEALPHKAVTPMPTQRLSGYAGSFENKFTEQGADELAVVVVRSRQIQPALSRSNLHGKKLVHCPSASPRGNEKVPEC